jgi:hypothetical protein
MGLFAVSHLAARHGVRVRLRTSPAGGLTALVWLPDTITDRDEAVPGGWPADAYAHLPGAAPEEVPVPPGQLLRVGGYYLPMGGRRHGAHERSATPSVVTGPPVIPGSAIPEPAIPEPGFPEPVAPEPPERLPVVVAAPVAGSLAASGLPLRIPQASIPQANRMPGSAGPEPDEAPPVTRSADAARSRLGGYQRGTRRAEQRITGTVKRADQERADH